MRIIERPLEGVKLIVPDVFGDERGFFLETFQAKRYGEEAGISLPFVQDNYSRSSFNVLRGLHFQYNKPQGKLVRVVKGKVFDVAVDIRPDSPTFGRWDGAVLSEENKHQFWIPPGMAHGFVVLSDTADFEYKCTDYYDPKDEGVIIWDDPEIGIEWPITSPSLSAKDSQGVLLSELQL